MTRLYHTQDSMTVRTYDGKEGVLAQFYRYRFPIDLAFSTTINKAQGQSLQHVGVMLPKAVFAHGQLSVPGTLTFKRHSRIWSLDRCLFQMFTTPSTSLIELSYLNELFATYNTTNLWVFEIDPSLAHRPLFLTCVSRGGAAVKVSCSGSLSTRG